MTDTLKADAWMHSSKIEKYFRVQAYSTAMQDRSKQMLHSCYKGTANICLINIIQMSALLKSVTHLHNW